MASVETGTNAGAPLSDDDKESAMKVGSLIKISKEPIKAGVKAPRRNKHALEKDRTSVQMLCYPARYNVTPASRQSPVGRLWADFEQTLARLWTDFGPTLYPL